MTAIARLLNERTSIRAYRDRAVDEATVRELLDDARRAPSGGNLQPWRVIAVAGEAKDEIVTLAKRRLMQSFALAATERGLSTCMQEAWAMLRDTLHAHFALADDRMIYCGMALGYADPEAAVNALRTERVAVDEFASFRGFS
jgi:nitroreductase